MLKWPTKPLGEVLANFDSRRIPLSGRDRDKRRGPYRYYGAAGVIDYVDQPIFSGLHLLIGEDGSVVRDDGTPFTQLADGEFWVNNHAHVLRGKSDSETRYVYYAPKTINARPWVTGAVQPKLNQRNMNQIPIPFPVRSVREQIVEVLGALDDKIEQNRQTAGKLERLARVIFRAWFVDFEPVKAKAAGADSFPSMPQHVFDSLSLRFVDSEIGPMPEGWHSGSLGDVVDIHNSRRVPLSRREREQRRGSFRYYGATGIIDYVNDFLFEGLFVLVGEDGTVVNDQDRPVVQYIWGRFRVNNHAHVLTGSSGISTEYLRVLLDHINIRPFVTGAVQPKLSQRNLKSVPIVVPPPETAAAFDDIIAPLFAWLRQAHDQSHALESMRDLLLPRLLSGQVRVEAAAG